MSLIEKPPKIIYPGNNKLLRREIGKIASRPDIVAASKKVEKFLKST